MERGESFKETKERTYSALGLAKDKYSFLVLIHKK